MLNTHIFFFAKLHFLKKKIDWSNIYTRIVSRNIDTVLEQNWETCYISFQRITFHSREEGKDQDSIQSSTISDLEHHMGKWQENTTHKRSALSQQVEGQNVTDGINLTLSSDVDQDT